ncbi:NucA/NucB deoxyribonuclease domain-containing protein [Kitasatospora xanthocidica]|nr:NucA/NucB deoxyribonuclease domain-containing protein [Kitasatospora xanthocidica]
MATFTSASPFPETPIGAPIGRAIESITNSGGIESAAGDTSAALPRPAIPSPQESEALKPQKQYSSNQAGEPSTQSPSSTSSTVDFGACRNNPSGAAAEGVVIDRFNFCRHYYSKCILYGIAGEILGVLDWRVTEVGRGASSNLDGNEALISAEMTEFKTSGFYNDSSRLTIYLGTNAKQGQKACYVKGALNPITNTVAQWKANGLLGWSILNDENLGTDNEKIVNCMWSIYNRSAPYLETWTNWATVPFQDIRFDHAIYLPQRMGAVFSRVIPVMRYSRTDPRVKGVAEHIYTAFTNPNSTLPARTDNGTKTIPGNFKATTPSLITRLYPQDNPIAQQAYRDNRAEVSRACAPLPHKPDEECDEFPFASTWEGAGRGDGNFSVQYVDGTQNGNAGTDLGIWYGSERIIHNDKFAVEILP